jgi:hypothetical protein
MKNSQGGLFDIQDCNKMISIADRNSMSLTKCGSLVCMQTGRDHDLVLKDVLSAPKLGMVLVSIPAVANSGLTVLFKPDLVMFDSNRNTEARGKQRGQV